MALPSSLNERWMTAFEEDPDNSGTARLKVDASVTASIGDVDVVSVIPGTGATNLGKAQDSAVGATDTGIAPLYVRDDALSAITPAENDYAVGRVDANGAHWVHVAAGTEAFGKLAANSGVDIGDVDVTSIIPGVGATNLGKAIDTATGGTDTGVLALATRDDALGSLTPAEGDNVQLRTDANGALWTRIDRNPTVTAATGSGAISTTTAIAAKHRVIAITCHFSAAPTTSENFVIKIDANAGAAYDTTLFTTNPSASAATDIFWQPDDELLMVSGDEIAVTFTNTDARTYGLRIVTVPV